MTEYLGLLDPATRKYYLQKGEIRPVHVLSTSDNSEVKGGVLTIEGLEEGTEETHRFSFMFGRHLIPPAIKLLYLLACSMDDRHTLRTKHVIKRIASEL